MVHSWEFRVFISVANLQGKDGIQIFNWLQLNGLVLSSEDFFRRSQGNVGRKDVYVLLGGLEKLNLTNACVGLKLRGAAENCELKVRHYSHETRNICDKQDNNNDKESTVTDEPVTEEPVIGLEEWSKNRGLTFDERSVQNFLVPFHHFSGEEQRNGINNFSELRVTFENQVCIQKTRTQNRNIQLDFLNVFTTTQNQKLQVQTEKSYSRWISINIESYSKNDTTDVIHKSRLLHCLGSFEKEIVIGGFPTFVSYLCSEK